MKTTRGVSALQATAGSFGVIATVCSLTALAWPARVAWPSQGLAARPGATLKFAMTGPPWNLSADLDGLPLPVQQQWGGCSLTLPADAGDGPHRLTLRTGGPRGEAVARGVIVDGTPPALKLLQPAPDLAVASTSGRFAGRSEAGSDVSVALATGQKFSVRTDAHGKFKLAAALKPGWNDYTVVAADAAGNTKQARGRLFSDLAAPRVMLERLVPGAAAAALRGKDCPKDTFRVRVISQDDSGLTRLRARLDDAPWQVLSFNAARRGGEEVADFPLRDLAQGTRKLAVEATDRSGRRTLESVEFLVDSSETFGTKTLTAGARGEDVRQLQKRLLEAHELSDGQLSGFFDEDTEVAVRAFQEKQGLPTTGRVGSATRVALGPKILVNLARFELVLDRPGEEPQRFSIACGQPSWPTPPGRFEVASLEKDPAWIPPDSPWAKEAKTIPPGPSNPLGTRWIGLSWGNVGIHGTNADWTIGSASSHGCLRMHLSDVEQLYDMVGMGMPVTIYSGNESDPVLQRYWP